MSSPPVQILSEEDPMNNDGEGKEFLLAKATMFTPRKILNYLTDYLPRADFPAIVEINHNNIKQSDSDDEKDGSDNSDSEDSDDEDDRPQWQKDMEEEIFYQILG
jgi:hypothetical protein